MSNKQLRQTIRFVHLIVSIGVLAMVYSEAFRSNPTMIAIMQFMGIPVIVFSGLALWQQARLSRWRRSLGTN